MWKLQQTYCSDPFRENSVSEFLGRLLALHYFVCRSIHFEKGFKKSQKLPVLHHRMA